MLTIWSLYISFLSILLTGMIMGKKSLRRNIIFLVLYSATWWFALSAGLWIYAFASAGKSAANEIVLDLYAQSWHEMKSIPSNLVEKWRK